MPITPTYPGVYIQELPSTSHTITPASTSVAAFVGYTHPLQTGLPWTTPLSPRSAANPQTAPAIPLSSFAEYLTNFGGFFDSPWVEDYVGRAVFQFFQNGGSTAYVVGLTDPNYTAATAVIRSSPPITLTALEPVGIESGSPLTEIGIPMQVTITNLQKTNNLNDTADIVISYGTQVETYRKVVIGNLSTQAAVPATPSQPAQPAGALAGSQLVSITPPSAAPTSYPTGSPPGSATVIPFGYASPLPASYSSINLQAIGEVFTDNYPLDKVLPTFNLLVIPGITDPGVLAEGVAYAERKRAFYIMDSPPNWDVDAPSTGNSPNSPVDDLGVLPVPVSTNAAIYFPWLQTTDPVTNSKTSPVTNSPVTSPPSGFVAGIYAREDANYGVWKSPAGLETTLNGALGVVPTGVMTDAQQGALNQQGINCLRQFPSLPPVVYGARTLAYRDPALKDQWGYIAVRRMALFLEQSLYTNLTWAVFQPNDPALWQALTVDVSAFMLGLFRQGAFAGTKPSEAFLVKCDNTTTTQTDINNGIVNILVGFAPLKPAEFVIVQIAQLAGQATS
jgi:phage tail sheath protein FI